MYLKILLYFIRTNHRAYKWYLGGILAWVVGMTLQKLFAGIIAANATDHLVEIGTQPIDVWAEFSPYIFGVLLAAFGGQILIDLGFFGTAQTIRRASPIVTREVFAWLLRQKLAYYADNFAGSITSQVSKFLASHQTFVDAISMQIVKMSVIVIMSIAVISFYSPLLGGFLLGWIVVFVTLVRFSTRLRLVYTRRAAAAQNDIVGHIADVIGNISIVAAYAKNEAEQAQNSRLTERKSDLAYKSWLYAIATDLVFGVMMAVLVVSMLWLSIVQVSSGAISIGTLLLTQVFITQIIAELWGLASLMRNIDNALADAEFVGSAMLSEQKDEESTAALRVKSGAIEFREVDFAYENKTVFENFTLTIPAGQRVGLVGHSGSGKTTLTKLLLRFMEIDRGAITIDSQSITDVSLRSLRDSMAYVPQEPLLFHRTLRENIAYARPDATDDEVMIAAKKAHAWEFIVELPDGLDTMVGERGVKLSGGQRQRIAIARAILKNAPILILDEATSALDSESEALIQDALHELMKGRTSIVIAHRLSTIQALDRIVVLDKGVVCEDGTHKNLVRQRGVYAGLWRRQSGGFIEE